LNEVRLYALTLSSSKAPLNRVIDRALCLESARASGVKGGGVVFILDDVQLGV
jgi:hypothetical protein